MRHILAASKERYAFFRSSSSDSTAEAKAQVAIVVDLLCLAFHSIAHRGQNSCYVQLIKGRKSEEEPGEMMADGYEGQGRSFWNEESEDSEYETDGDGDDDEMDDLRSVRDDDGDGGCREDRKTLRELMVERKMLADALGEQGRDGEDVGDGTDSELSDAFSMSDQTPAPSVPRLPLSPYDFELWCSRLTLAG